MHVIDAALGDLFGNQRFGQEFQTGVGRLTVKKIPMRIGDRVMHGRLHIENVLVAGQEFSVTVEIHVSQKTSSVEGFDSRGADGNRPQFVHIDALNADQGPGQVEMQSPRNEGRIGLAKPRYQALLVAANDVETAEQIEYNKSRAPRRHLFHGAPPLPSGGASRSAPPGGTLTAVFGGFSGCTSRRSPLPTGSGTPSVSSLKRRLPDDRTSVVRSERTFEYVASVRWNS